MIRNYLLAAVTAVGFVAAMGVGTAQAKPKPKPILPFPVKPVHDDHHGRRDGDHDRDRDHDRWRDHDRRVDVIVALPDPGNLTGYRGQDGQTFYFQVTGNSGAGSVWGDGVYTDDSVLAAAAVHAGVLADGQTGLVKVTILAGADGYGGSDRNGVASGDWGAWVGSYRIEP